MTGQTVCYVFLMWPFGGTDLCTEICRYISLVLVGLPISPSSRASWDAQLLKIPVVSPSVMNCCVIRVEYYVKVRCLLFV